MNTYLRASVGMDRYGITSDKAIKVGEKSSTVSYGAEKGNDLSSENKVFKAIQEKCQIWHICLEIKIQQVL